MAVNNKTIDILSNNISINKNKLSISLKDVKLNKNTKYDINISSGAIKDINNNIIKTPNFFFSTGEEEDVVGALIPYAGNNIPDGYLLCDGSAISRTTYSDLFQAIGITYGSGDEETTFNLPDFRNRVIWGSDTSGTVLSAGLPNITGNLQAARMGDNLDGSGDVTHWNSDRTTGCLKAKLDASNTNRNVSTGTREGGNCLSAIDFDASKSNLIYGNSETVQPPAITIKILIKY